MLYKEFYLDIEKHNMWVYWVVANTVLCTGDFSC